MHVRVCAVCVRLVLHACACSGTGVTGKRQEQVCRSLLSLLLCPLVCLSVKCPWTCVCVFCTVRVCEHVCVYVCHSVQGMQLNSLSVIDDEGGRNSSNKKVVRKKWLSLSVCLSVRMGPDVGRAHKNPPIPHTHPSPTHPLTTTIHYDVTLHNHTSPEGRVGLVVGGLERGGGREERGRPLRETEGGGGGGGWRGVIDGTDKHFSVDGYANTLR